MWSARGVRIDPTCLGSTLQQSRLAIVELLVRSPGDGGGGRSVRLGCSGCPSIGEPTREPEGPVHAAVEKSLATYSSAAAAAAATVVGLGWVICAMRDHLA